MRNSTAIGHVLHKMSAACALCLRRKLPHARMRFLELCTWMLRNTCTSCIIIKFGGCFAIHQTAKLESSPNFPAIWYMHITSSTEEHSTSSIPLYILMQISSQKVKPKRKFKASSVTTSPVLSDDVPRTYHHSSAGEYSACSSAGSGCSFYGPRRWTRKHVCT